MNMMGELNFFLGLQIKQTKEDIFINQEKYVKDVMKFKLQDAKTIRTPMSTSTKLDKYEKGKSINMTVYSGSVVYFILLLVNLT